MDIVGKPFMVRGFSAVFEHTLLLYVYTTVTSPAVRPVTTPPVVILAEPDPFLIDHVPFEVVFVNASVMALTQTSDAPSAIADTSGNSFINMIPAKEGLTHKEPDVVTVYANDPLISGVPLIVNVFAPALYVPVTPVGNDSGVIEASVPAPPIVKIILVIALLIQILGLAFADVREIVASAFTNIVPPIEGLTQEEPDVVTEYGNDPLIAGVPLIVNVFASVLYVPVTPVGNDPAVIEAPVPALLTV